MPGHVEHFRQIRGDPSFRKKEGIMGIRALEESVKGYSTSNKGSNRQEKLLCHKNWTKNKLLLRLGQSHIGGHFFFNRS